MVNRKDGFGHVLTVIRKKEKDISVASVTKYGKKPSIYSCYILASFALGLKLCLH